MQDGQGACQGQSPSNETRRNDKTESGSVDFFNILRKIAAELIHKFGLFSCSKFRGLSIK